MTWGLVARADHGGLGTLSREIARHLDPDRILVVEMAAGTGRGPSLAHELMLENPTSRIISTVYHPRGELDPDPTRGFLDGLDVVLGLETWYDPRFAGWAARAGVRSHLYAMRELYAAGGCYRADRVWFPEPIGTASGLPSDVDGRPPYVLPWPTTPIPRSRERRPDGEPLVVLHPAGQAMLDRNGTLVLRRALALAEESFVVRVHGGPDVIPGQIIETTVGRSRWIAIGFDFARWEDQYRLGDLLALPRRYGWLSLPPLEAAAAGIPSIMTRLWPQTDWRIGYPTVDPGPPAPYRMKGGTINVYDPNPYDLADRLDRISRDRTDLAVRSLQAAAWADGRSWGLLGSLWRKALEQ